MDTHIELNKKNIIHNYLALKKNIPFATQIICVVKSNAYGYGLSEVITMLDDVSDMYAVDSLDELKTVRKISKKPVLIFQQLSPESIVDAAKLKCDFSVGSEDYLVLLNKLAVAHDFKPRVHLEIDAEFGRTGFLPNELEGISNKKYPNIIFDSIYSHYSCSTDYPLNKFDRVQDNILNEARTIFKKKGINVKSHISSTSSTLVHGVKDDNYIRVGAGIYGIYPSEYVKKYTRVKNLLPILRWVTSVAHIKVLPKNHPVGYGLSLIHI